MGSMPNLDTSEIVGTPTAEIESQTQIVRDDVLS